MNDIAKPFSIARDDVPVQFDSDGMATIHDSSFLQNPRFSEAYRFGCEVKTGAGDALHIEWRAWIAVWAAEQALRCIGDFVECGVYTGILSGTVSKWLEFADHSDRKFWLLDTFIGLPEDQITPSEREINIQNYNSEYNRHGMADLVRNKFSSYPNVFVVEGRVPDTLDQITSESIAYLSLDMNMVYPEICAAEALWPRISPGGVLLLDDYNQLAHFHQRERYNAFASERNVPILGLPTGQGIIIKPVLF